MKSYILFTTATLALFGIAVCSPALLPSEVLITQVIGLLNHIVSTLSQAVQVIDKELASNNAAAALRDVSANITSVINLLSQALTILGTLNGGK